MYHRGGMSNVWRHLALLLLVGMTVGCDRVSKHFAALELAGEPRQSFLADTVRLEYAENAGAFLSLGHDWSYAARTTVFTIGTGLILCLMLAAAFRVQLSGPALVGMAFYFAGGASNLVDRIVRGSVIDFMNVGVGPLRTGIFNVADMAILLGVGIFVFTHRQSADHGESEPPDSGGPEGPPYICPPERQAADEETGRPGLQVQEDKCRPGLQARQDGDE
jgi:signal peptidase II